MRPRRGATRKGRAAAAFRAQAAKRRTTPPLLSGEDHGAPIVVTAADVRARPDRWVEPFLEANRAALARLDLAPEVRAADGDVTVRLRPSSRIGAVPLLAPSDRRVAAGLVVRPRFGWNSAGRVLVRLGFSVEPRVGGGPLVPGSAREVPPWVLAGPVLRRLEELLKRLGRSFDFVEEERAAPRGSIDWSRYAPTSTRRSRTRRWPTPTPSTRCSRTRGRPAPTRRPIRRSPSRRSPPARAACG